MDEFNKSAQQSELSGTQGSENADTSQKSNAFNGETDGSKEFSESPEASAQAASHKTAENAKAAQRRREQREKEIRERAIIESIGGVNPFTGEEVKDTTDIDEYLLMRKIESEGGDPVLDYAKWHRAQAKSAAAVAKKESDEKEWYANDGKAFAEKYPDVNISELIADKNFGLYAEGKVGVMPLAQIYEGFLKITDEYERRAKAQAAQYYANSKATPGALASPEPAVSDFISREDAAKMSRDEVKRNYDKIRASMAKW